MPLGEPALEELFEPVSNGRHLCKRPTRPASVLMDLGLRQLVNCQSGAVPFKVSYRVLNDVAFDRAGLLMLSFQSTHKAIDCLRLLSC